MTDASDERPRCGECPMFMRHDPYQWGSCEGYCKDGKCYGFRNAADRCVLPSEFWKEIRGVQGG